MLRTLIIACLCLAVPISAKPQSKNSSSNKNVPSNCVLNEKRANPVNPSTYYHCRADGPTLLKCPDAMVFDSVAKDCVRIVLPVNNVTVAGLPGDNVLLTAPVGSPGRATTPTPGWSAGGWTAGGWSSAPTTAGPTTASTTTTSAPPGSCPAVQDSESPSVYLPNPADCGSFYQCSNGVPILQPCPAGLHWSTALTTCTWPADAGCTAGGGGGKQVLYAVTDNKID